MTNLLAKRWITRATIALAIAALSTTPGCTSSEKAQDEVDAEGQVSAEGDFSQESSDTPSQQAAAPEAGGGLSQELALEELGQPLNEGSQATPAAATNSPSNPEPAIATEPAVSNTQPSSSFSGNFAETSISDIRYVARKGGGTVVVETSSPATYHTREVPAQSQAIIEIANAQLPDKLKRPYVTKDFNQSISSINAYQDKGSSTVRVVVQFRSPMRADVKQEGRALMLTAVDSATELDESSTLGTETGEVAGSDFGGSDDGAESTGESGGSRRSTDSRDPRILPASSVDGTNYDNVKFYGKPISIEVRDTPVREVINLIAEQSGANLVLAGEIEGNISLKLRQIPWDQALLLVMKTRNLGYVRQGTILRIAPYDALQKEMESAKKVADAQKSAEPLKVKVIPVGYAKVADMEKQVTPFLSSRGKVVSDARTNSLLVTDTPDVLDRVANLVRTLDLPPLQVLIEAKIIEARETFSRDFGINWGYSGAEVALGNQTLRQDFNLRLPTTSTAAMNFRFGQFDIFGDIQARLGLAERNDLVKIISSPRIVVLNNEQATINQSTKIPVNSTSTTGGTVTNSVTYQEVPLKLDVVPQVTSENDVILQVNVTRQFAGNRVGGQEPDINAREAKTKVLVRNGNTAVIGGVYQSDTNEGEQGFPWVKNIPVVGWLFKNHTKTNEKNELLVFLTPRILNAEKSIQKETSL